MTPVHENGGPLSIEHEMAVLRGNNERRVMALRQRGVNVDADSLLIILYLEELLRRSSDDPQAGELAIRAIRARFEAKLSQVLSAQERALAHDVLTAPPMRVQPLGRG